MKIIIGLGNPGKQFEKTRHNAGFIIIEQLQKKLLLPEFKLDKKFNAEISEGIFAISNTPQNSKLLLIKPQTFMNLSGQSVRTIMDFYKVSPEDIVVIHDDLDIELGKFKISLDSSAGGHNGVVDIVEKLGTQKFKRIRIGIEGSELKKERLMSGSDFVLQKFSDQEIETIEKLTEEIAKHL